MEVTDLTERTNRIGPNANANAIRFSRKRIGERNLRSMDMVRVCPRLLAGVAPNHHRLALSSKPSPTLSVTPFVRG